MSGLKTTIGFIAWAMVTLGLGASPICAAQDDRRRPKDPIDDLVAVTVTSDGRAIVIATPALPELSLRASFGLSIKASEWRYRVLRLRKTEPSVVKQVWLSTSGTKMLVRFTDGQYNVLDLTKPILQFGRLVQQTLAPQTLAPNAASLNTDTHSLTGERYLVAAAEGVETRGDEGFGANDAPWKTDASTAGCQTAFLTGVTIGSRRVVAGSPEDAVEMSAIVLANDGLVCRVSRLGAEAAVVAAPTRIIAPTLTDAVVLASDDRNKIRVVATIAYPAATIAWSSGSRYRLASSGLITAPCGVPSSTVPCASPSKMG
jgi:hypothetical protein